jgi:hypothetical protein
MRDALSLTDQAISFGNGGLAEAEVRDMFGGVDRSHVFTLIEALALRDGASVVQTCESLRHFGAIGQFIVGRDGHGIAAHGRSSKPRHKRLPAMTPTPMSTRMARVDAPTPASR